MIDRLKQILESIQKQVEFDEKEHKYTINGKEYIPVNTYIKKFVKEPNFDEIADRINKLRLTDIREEWERKKQEAIEKGNELHKFAEDYIKGKAVISLDSRFKQDKIAIIEFLELLIEEYKHEVIAVEQRIFDDSIYVAGTMDLLTYSHRNGKLFILDWKTNSDLNKEVGEFIFNRQKITVKDKYALQLSMYKYMLKFFLPDDVEINLGLIHIHNGQYKYIPLNTIEKHHLYEAV